MNVKDHKNKPPIKLKKPDGFGNQQFYELQSQLSACRAENARLREALGEAVLEMEAVVREVERGENGVATHMMAMALQHKVDRGKSALSQSTPPQNVVIVPRETLDEALSALYGSREVLGSVANIQHAIDLLRAALGAP